VLTEIGFLLIRIEEDLCSKSLSRSDVDDWRVVLGKWRAHLHTINGWCTRYIHNVKVLGINDEQRLKTTSADALNDAQKEQRRRLEVVIQEMERFQLRIKVVLEHVESTFTALIGTMQITQAGQVGKITLLAFFFLPLTLVVSVFSMNLAVRSYSTYLCVDIVAHQFAELSCQRNPMVVGARVFSRGVGCDECGILFSILLDQMPSEIAKSKGH
jgi:Mg2+ and Co2+ transporter CorA